MKSATTSKKAASARKRKPAPRVHPHHDQDEYEKFLGVLGHVVDRWIADGGGRLFTTDAPRAALWKAYLSGFPDARTRQHYDCAACRSFVMRFGRLVTISASPEHIGHQKSLWAMSLAPLMNRPAVPMLYVPGLLAMAKIVAKAKVSGVFYSAEEVWGRPITGEWRHMAVAPELESGASWLWSSPLSTPGQLMAKKAQEYRMLCRALGEYQRPLMEQALSLLSCGTLPRAEKVIEAVRFLLDTQTDRARAATANRVRNVTWLRTACAPEGFVHVRSGVLGTLLDDMKAGRAASDIRRRFADKMEPTKYRRPTAAPTAGQIDVAEKLVERLGIASSLPRRFAFVSEVPAIWQPHRSPAPGTQGTGVFAKLREPRETLRAYDGAAVTRITWKKFERDVLPLAKTMVYPVQYGPSPYVAITTAVNLDAPPIIQWDYPALGRRNPFAWYVYATGSRPDQWGLVPMTEARVLAVCRFPHEWRGHEADAVARFQRGAIFLLEGCRDRRPDSAGLFPEILRSELHGARAVIEAYSQSARVQYLGGALVDGQAACGIEAGRNQEIPVTVETSAGLRVRYLIDRYE